MKKVYYGLAETASEGCSVKKLDTLIEEKKVFNLPL